MNPDDLTKMLQKQLIKMKVLDDNDYKYDKQGFMKNSDDMYEYTGNDYDDGSSYRSGSPMDRHRYVLEREYQLGFEFGKQQGFDEGYKKAMREQGKARQPPKPTDEQVQESISIADQLL